MFVFRISRVLLYVLVHYLLIWAELNSLWLPRAWRTLKPKFARIELLLLRVILVLSFSIYSAWSMTRIILQSKCNRFSGYLANNFAVSAARIVSSFGSASKRTMQAETEEKLIGLSRLTRAPIDEYIVDNTCCNPFMLSGERRIGNCVTCLYIGKCQIHWDSGTSM